MVLFDLPKALDTVWRQELRLQRVRADINGRVHKCLKARPVMEYGSNMWHTASRSNKGKLNRTQNIGLHIILGVMKSNPVKEMEKTAALEPEENRRYYKVGFQGEKMKRLPSRPLHCNLQQSSRSRLQP